MSSVSRLNTKLDAANHIRMTARRLGVLVTSTVNGLGDPLVIKVDREGDLTLIREGQWTSVYRHPQAKLEELRWQELGLFLDRCEEFGFKF